METTPQQDLFAPQDQIVQASTGKRLANYLIDLVFFYIIFAVVLFGIIIGNPETAETLDDDSIGTDFMLRLLTLISFGLYMFLVEMIFKGKSLGKLITGTRAVNEDGTPISPGTALLRGLSRMVPFEQFSALGNPSYPWHDKWTRTYVIDEKASKIPGEV
jgi:uncharacterized RDD family membrane protein YckC